MVKQDVIEFQDVNAFSEDLGFMSLYSGGFCAQFELTDDADLAVEAKQTGEVYIFVGAVLNLD